MYSQEVVPSHHTIRTFCPRAPCGTVRTAFVFTTVRDQKCHVAKRKSSTQLPGLDTEAVHSMLFTLFSLSHG